MKLITFWGIALRSLLANKLRSALTMLGIIIGIASVIAMLSLGEGFQEGITASISDLGSDSIYVQPSNPDAPGGFMSQALAAPSLTLDDAEALEEIAGVGIVVAYNENFLEVAVGDKSKTVVFDGSTVGWLETLGYEMEYGQFYSDRNVTRRDSVIVLGSEVAQDLFGSASAALNQEVKVSGKAFTVLGVLATKGGAMMGFSMDAIAVVPITTYQTKLFAQRTPQGDDAVQAIALLMEDANQKSFIIADIEQILRHRHRIADGDNNDFSIVTPEQILGLVNVITGALTAFLAAIAAISLLVASIGIMNIMLVSVTERTREIGIRKAVGAKRYHILIQFLIEAGTLSLVGGAIGIILGALTAWGVAQLDLGITLVVTIAPGTVLLAAGVSFFIGIVSGIYPAARAASLNPIDALRYG
jgi:putative ABC transport system permease protein